MCVCVSSLSRGYSKIKFFPKIEKKQCLTDIENPKTKYSEQYYVVSKNIFCLSIKSYVFRSRDRP